MRGVRHEKKTPEPTPEPFVPDATEVEMIAKTIWGEARGTSMTEKAAVAWCILNRVDSGEYWDWSLDSPYEIGKGE